MKRALSIIVIVIAMSSAQGAVTYTGNLSVDNGLYATDHWNKSSTTLSWVVDDTTTQGLWHYEYTVSVRKDNIDFLVLETADTLTASNLSNLSSNPSNWIDAINLGNFYSASPEDFFGLKIDAKYGLKTVTISFDSDYAPGWGDFFATDGNKNYLTNAGMGIIDPLGGPANGSINNHILVPDMVASTASPVPLPGAMLLTGLGLELVRKIKRKRYI